MVKHKPLPTRIVQSVVHELTELRYDLYLIIERGIEDSAVDRLLYNPRSEAGDGACSCIERGVVKYHRRHPCSDKIECKRTMIQLTEMVKRHWIKAGKSSEFPIDVLPIPSCMSYLWFYESIKENKILDDLTSADIVTYATARIQLISEMIDWINSFMSISDGTRDRTSKIRYDGGNSTIIGNVEYHEGDNEAVR